MADQGKGLKPPPIQNPGPDPGLNMAIVAAPIAAEEFATQKAEIDAIKKGNAFRLASIRRQQEQKNNASQELNSSFLATAAGTASEEQRSVRPPHSRGPGRAMTAFERAQFDQDRSERALSIPQPQFEPTARAAIDAKHEAQNHRILGIPLPQEQPNNDGVMVLQQDFRNRGPISRSSQAEPEETTQVGRKLSLKSSKKALLGFFGFGNKSEPLPPNVPQKASRILVSPVKKRRLRLQNKVQRSESSKTLPSQGAFRTQSQKDVTKGANRSFAGRVREHGSMRQSERATAFGSRAPDRRPHTSHGASQQTMIHAAPQQALDSSFFSQPLDRSIRSDSHSDAIVNQESARSLEYYMRKALPPLPLSERAAPDSGSVGSILSLYNQAPAVDSPPRPPTRGKTPRPNVFVPPNLCPPGAFEQHGTVINAGKRIFSTHPTIEGTRYSAHESSRQDDGTKVEMRAAGPWSNEGGLYKSSWDSSSGSGFTLPLNLPKGFRTPTMYSPDSGERESGLSPSKNTNSNRWLLAQPSRPRVEHDRLASQGSIPITFQGLATEITPENTLDNPAGNDKLRATIKKAKSAKSTKLVAPSRHDPIPQQLEGGKLPVSKRLNMHAEPQDINTRQARPQSAYDVTRDESVLRHQPGFSNLGAVANLTPNKDPRLSTLNISKHPSAIPNPLFANRSKKGLNMSDPGVPAQGLGHNSGHNHATPAGNGSHGSPTNRQNRQALRSENDSPVHDGYNNVDFGQNAPMALPFGSPNASPYGDLQATISTYSPGSSVLVSHLSHNDFLTHLDIVHHHMDGLNRSVLTGINDLKLHSDHREAALVQQVGNQISTAMARDVEHDTSRLAALKETEGEKIDEILAVLKEDVAAPVASITEVTSGVHDDLKGVQRALEANAAKVDEVLNQMKYLTAAFQSRVTVSQYPDQQRRPPANTGPDGYRVDQLHHTGVGGLHEGRQYNGDRSQSRSDGNAPIARAYPVYGGTSDGAVFNYPPAGSMPPAPSDTTSFDTGNSTVPYTYGQQYRYIQ